MSHEPQRNQRRPLIDWSDKHFETRAIRSGQDPDPTTGSVVIPINMASTYRHDALGEFKGYEYGRTGNPTRTALEDLIERKMRGETRSAKRRQPEPKVIDLMEALKASVAESKRGGANGAKPKKAAPKRASRAKSRATAASGSACPCFSCSARWTCCMNRWKWMRCFRPTAAHV